MTSTKRLRQIRHALVGQQHGRCCYCKRLFGKKASPLGATIEHCKARMDGGTDAPENLAAACRHCNQLRGKQMNRARQLKGAAKAQPSPSAAL